MNKRIYEVKEFEKNEIGIISSARIFGEGVDIKICDAICFADGKSSSIDIIQYVGRCLRTCKSKPNKKSFIIIPFLLNENEDFFDYENKSYIKLRKILKTIGTTDDLITEQLQLVNCNINNYFEKEINTKITIRDKNSQIDIKNFHQKIITKIFDKSGNFVDITRNKFIFENKKRYEKKEDLIDTRKKCYKFFKENNIIYEPIKINNFVRYALGDYLYNKIKVNYYQTIESLKDACVNLQITNSEEYKNKCYKNKKLPPYEYINCGFFCDINPKFNLTIVLSNNIDNEF